MGVRSLSVLLSKRADLSLDMILTVAIIFGLGIAFIFLGDTFTEINTDIQGFSDMSSDSKQSLDDVHSSFNSDFDNSIGLIFIGFALFMLISAWFVDTHPVFFVVSLILMAILILVIVVLANTFEEVVSGTSSLADYNLTVFIMSHIVELIIGLGTLVSIILYGRYTQ